MKVYQSHNDFFAFLYEVEWNFVEVQKGFEK